MPALTSSDPSALMPARPERRPTDDRRLDIWFAGWSGRRPESLAVQRVALSQTLGASSGDERSVSHRGVRWRKALSPVFQNDRRAERMPRTARWAMRAGLAVALFLGDIFARSLRLRRTKTAAK